MTGVYLSALVPESWGESFRVSKRKISHRPADLKHFGQKYRTHLLVVAQILRVTTNFRRRLHVDGDYCRRRNRFCTKMIIHFLCLQRDQALRWSIWQENCSGKLAWRAPRSRKDVLQRNPFLHSFYTSTISPPKDVASCSHQRRYESLLANSISLTAI